MADQYTKIVLTVIAAALVIIVFKDAFLTSHVVVDNVGHWLNTKANRRPTLIRASESLEVAVEEMKPLIDVRVVHLEGVQEPIEVRPVR
jgi:hypothetical protein